MLIKVDFVPFLQRFVAFIKFQTFVFCLLALPFIIITPYVMLVPAFLVFGEMFQAFRLSKYYLQSFFVDIKQGVITIEVFKYNKFDYQKNLTLDEINVDFSRVPNKFISVYELKIISLKTRKVLISQANVGRWNLNELITICDSIKKYKGEKLITKILPSDL